MMAPLMWMIEVRPAGALCARGRSPASGVEGFNLPVPPTWPLAERLRAALRRPRSSYSPRHTAARFLAR